MRVSPLIGLGPFAVTAILLVPAAAPAQGTPADYARAEGVRDRYRGAVIGAVDQSGWVDSTPRFWYRRSTADGSEFVVVDARTHQKRVAFDHARLADALSEVVHRPIKKDSLPFQTLTFMDHERALVLQVDTLRLRCTLPDYQCTNAAARDGGRDDRGVGGALYGALPTDDGGVRRSPDKRWEALIRNHNVYVRPAGGSQGTMLSYDGTDAEPYALRTLAWSPDSRKLAIFKVRSGYRREVILVESSPPDQVQPRYIKRLYNKPGDVLDQGQAAVFDIATKRQSIVDNALYPNAYNLTPLVWRHDSRTVSFEYNQRGHQLYRLLEVDASTGKARAVIDEQSSTFFEYSAKKYAFDLDDGREIIWMSERDGWNHLYLYDGVAGRVKHQITRGEWVVRGVSRVDSATRQIWFSASGMEPGADPYFVHYYRINIDGTGLTRLTDADAMHSVIFSPDVQYYVDTWSRIDLPPIAQLRRTRDKSLVMELEKADASALYATGWKAPELFVSKSRDGRWDIYGEIIRPSDFDPRRKYPVVENIYAGPHGSFVPKTFSAQAAMQAIAELGFIVVQIDGMGTSNRSKAFHDVAFRNLRDAGFPDRIIWHKAVAAKYPYYDAGRVGIYGTSAGGQSALAALLWHPEFYTVAVSAAGSHDNRMDKTWWNEQWMGWPIGPEYAANSNVDNAHLLQGKLLLIVGEMDRNVDPSTTLQVANALIQAKKQFDLLVIPGADHTSGGEYGDRKRWDFFVHNLLGVEPPDRNAVTAGRRAVQ